MLRFIKKSSYSVLLMTFLLMITSCGQRKVPHETVSSEDLAQQIVNGLADGFKSGEIDVTTREKKIISNIINNALENPETTMMSLKQAAEKAGFNATFPESLSGVEPYFSAVADSLLEASYKTGDGNDIVIRKSNSSDSLTHVADIAAGNKTKITQKIGDTEVSIVLDQGKIYDAIWENGDNAYSVYSQGGIDEETLKSLIKTVQ